MQTNNLCAVGRLWLLALVAAVVTFGASSFASAQNRFGRDYMPNLVVFDHHGKPLRFYDDLIHGKIVLISFIYTSCTDVCPLITARLAEVQDKLGDDFGREFHFVSISIDPTRDTPEALKRYADAFRVKPGWTFVTGKPEDLKLIGHKLGERSKRLSDHQNDIVLGNDVTGEWARNSAFSDFDRIAESLRLMDPKRRSQVRTLSTVEPAPYIVDANRPGEILFARLCSTCHTVGRGDKVGPDLAGAASRRSPQWLMRMIMEPARLRRERDPEALALATRFPGAKMPSLGLSENDAQDLIAYVEAQTYRARGTATGMTTPPVGQSGHNH